MKKIAAGIVSGFLFLVIAAPFSFAQMGGPGPECGCQGAGMSMRRHDGMMMKQGPHFQRILASLGLDENQKKAVSDIRSRVAKDTVRKRADLQIARIDLRNILNKDKVDMAAVESNLKKTATLQTEIRLSHIKAWQEVKALLTPEQKKKLDELRAGPGAGRMLRGGMGMALAENNDGPQPEQE